MRDFTLHKLHALFSRFKDERYEFVSFLEYLEEPDKYPSVVILRHDVDRHPENSLKNAELEKMIGVHGTYYFRSVEGRFPEKEIRCIAESGHEIGYHYEDLDRSKGNEDNAMASFQENLEKLRQIAPVKTICMHGSPKSKYDNRDMWKERSYKEYGIIGETYFDVDFKKVLYITDTGRRWDGERVSIRDKVRGDRLGVIGERVEDRRQQTEDSREEEDRRQITEGRGNGAIKRPRLHSTQDIINALKNGELPDQIMLTIHPQRWTDEWVPWGWELVSQKVKNIVKYFIVKSRQ